MGSLFLLTQNTNALLRPIALVLGRIMNGIYVLLNSIGIKNIALTIIIFTIVAYLIMLPLTYQQQKFSKMSAIMQPEIQEIQKKYRNKKDSVSMQQQQAETQEVYKKYGIRPSGSCVFMIIQFLILIPLYRVIYNVPAYVTRVKEAFMPLVNAITDLGDSVYMPRMESFLASISEHNSVLRGISLNFDTGLLEDAQNSIIDVLYKCTSANWDQLSNIFSEISPDVINTVRASVEQFNSFFGMHAVTIVYSPWVLIRTSAAEGVILPIIIAILVPVISAGSQFLSIRLMPQANSGGMNGDQVGTSMRMMNYFMPIYSFFIVFFLPIGIGIYWIAGAAIRIVQQYIINRHFDKIDMKALVAENAKKAEAKQKKKAERKGVSGAQIQSAARINTRQIPRTMSEKAASVSKINEDALNKAGSSKGGGSSGKSGSSSSKSGSGSSKSGSSSAKSGSSSSKSKSSATKSAASSAKSGSSSAKSGSGATKSAASSAKSTASSAKSGSGAAKSGSDSAGSESGKAKAEGIMFGRRRKAEAAEAARQAAEDQRPEGKYKRGSMAELANMVEEYNERKNTK